MYVVVLAVPVFYLSISHAGVGLVKCIGDDGSITFTQGQCPEQSVSRSSVIVEDSMSHHGEYRMNELVVEHEKNVNNEMNADEEVKSASNAEFYTRVYGTKYSEMRDKLISDIKHSNLTNSKKSQLIMQVIGSYQDKEVRTEREYNMLVADLKNLRSSLRSIELGVEDENRKLSGMVSAFMGKPSHGNQPPGRWEQQETHDFELLGDKAIKDMKEARKIEGQFRKEKTLQEIGVWGREGRYKRALEECDNTPLANCR